LTSFQRLFSRFLKDKSGGNVIEYSMIAALVVIGLLAAMNAIGNSTKSMYDNLDEKWDAAEKGG
tara:strand:- start:97925 stop:98116 length:192 start_codon:yes stop_codon:yes gene_type:complete